MTLASIYGTLGRYLEAEEELKAVLAFHERTRGPEDMATLTDRRSLGEVLRREGRKLEAEKIERAVLAIRERLAGPENEEAMTDRGNLAITLTAEGKGEEAEKELRAVVAFRTKSRGAADPLTMDARNSLAAALSRQGKAGEAEKELRDILAICEGLPSVSQCPRNALQRNARHRPGKARQTRAGVTLSQRCEKATIAILGADHPNTKVATAYRKQLEEKVRKQEGGEGKDTGVRGVPQGA